MGWILTILILLTIISIIGAIGSFSGAEDAYYGTEKIRYQYTALFFIVLLVSCAILLFTLDFSTIDCGCQA